MQNRQAKFSIRNESVRELLSDQDISMHSTCRSHINYELTTLPLFTFVNTFSGQVLIAGLKSVISLCPHVLCLTQSVRRRLLLLHHTVFGQEMQLFCLKIIGEYGTISTSPVIVINKGRHERFTQREI